MKVTEKHPNFLRNFKDIESHPQEEEPTFPITPPVPVATIEELMEPDPPYWADKATKWMAVCEDNAVWPYSCHFITDIQAFMRRQRKRLDYFEEGVQYATANTIRRDLNQGWMSTLSMVLVVAICALLVLIALVIALYKFNGPETGQAMLPAVALGAVVTLPRPKRGTNGRIPDVDNPAGPFVRCYVYDCQEHEVRHKVAPLALIQNKYRNIKIYRCNMTFERLLFAGGVALVLAGMVFMPVYRLAPALLVFALVPTVLAAFGIGWLMSKAVLTRKFPLLTPFTCFYLWKPPVDEETGEIGGPLLIPIRHTYGRGVDPLIYDHFKDMAIAETKKLLEERGLEDEVKYRPTVNRSDLLHQQIEGRIQTAKRRMPERFSPKMQMGLLITMAFSCLGIFFFVTFATTGG